MFNKEMRCINCLLTHTGNHPHLCTVCRAALKATGVIASDKPAAGRKAWWVK